MPDIALGLQSANLEAFAASVGASFMAQWRDLGLYDDDVEGWGDAFGQAVTRTLKAGGRIHFNLTGMNLEEALGGDPNSWVGRYAAWELQQILCHVEWFDHTIFYYDGQVLTSDQLTNMALDRPHGG